MKTNILITKIQYHAPFAFDNTRTCVLKPIQHFFLCFVDPSLSFFSVKKTLLLFNWNCLQLFDKSHSASILSWINLVFVALIQCKASIRKAEQTVFPILMCLKDLLECFEGGKNKKTTKKSQALNWISIDEFRKLIRCKKPSLWKAHFSKERLDLSQKIKLSPQIIVFIPFGKRDLSWRDEQK